MTNITEAAGAAGTAMGAALAAGVDTISFGQEIIFTQYVRLILPLDGYVFLVNASVVSSNVTWLAAQAAAQATQLPLQFSVKGSLHYGTTTEQLEEHTFTNNNVVFTAENKVDALNLDNPLVVYMAMIDNIQFAFSARQPFYRQSGLFHYTGTAVFTDLTTQVIDTADQIDTLNVIVSNSIPLWLALSSYAPAVALVSNPGIMLYPSFVVPKNLLPPYGVVHVEPDRTQAWQTAPMFDPRSSTSQLCADKVKITLVGYRSNAAHDFIAWVQQYAEFTQNFGISNIPVVRDEKRRQVELNALAERKTIEFDVNYYQTRMNDVARQLIHSVIPSFSARS